MARFNCVLCHSKDFIFFLENMEDFEYGMKGEFRLAKCRSCGLISLVPLSTTEELLNFYPESYHCYNNPISNFTKLLVAFSLKKQAREIVKLIGKQGVVLDVGCAKGEHFEVFNKIGNWRLIGIDFNKRVAEEGRKKGRKIYCTTLEEFNYAKESFDLVIMDHLLEHVTNPVSTLKSANRLLKKNGYLIGSVPNINSLDRLLTGRYWGGYHFPRHVYHFTPQTLTKLFEKSHFNLEKVVFNLHTGHWALSIQNFLQSKTLTKVGIKNGRSFYYSLLLLFFLPLNFLQKQWRCTGIIDFVARKQQNYREKPRNILKP